MGCDNEEEEQSMRVDKSVIVLFRQMNLFLNRELLDEKLPQQAIASAFRKYSK